MPADNKLGPKDLKHRAVYEQWLEVESQAYNHPCSTLVKELFVKPVFFKQPADEAIVKTESEKLGKVLDIIENHLRKAGTKFIAADHVTLADIVYTPSTAVALKTPQSELYSKRPHVKAWVDNVIALPSWQKVLGLQKH